MEVKHGQVWLKHHVYGLSISCFCHVTNSMLDFILYQKRRLLLCNFLNLTPKVSSKSWKKFESGLAERLQLCVNIRFRPDVTGYDVTGYDPVSNSRQVYDKLLIGLRYNPDRLLVGVAGVWPAWYCLAHGVWYVWHCWHCLTHGVWYVWHCWCCLTHRVWYV